MRIQFSINSHISDSDNFSQAFLRSRSVDHASSRETRSNAIEYDLKKSLGNKISGGKIKKKERKKSDIKAIAPLYVRCDEFNSLLNALCCLL